MSLHVEAWAFVRFFMDIEGNTFSILLGDICVCTAHKVPNDARRRCDGVRRATKEKDFKIIKIFGKLRNERWGGKMFFVFN